MVRKLKELMGGAELPDPDLQGPEGEEGADASGEAPGPGTRQSQWITVLCRLQILCMKEDIRRSVLAGLKSLLETYPPERTPEGRVILLMMGSADQASLTNDEFIRRFGSNEATLPVLLAGAACETRLGKPLNQNIGFWEDAFKEDGLGCRPLFRESAVYDSKMSMDRPRSWDNNGVDPLPENLRILALKRWEGNTFHPSWGIGFYPMVGVKGDGDPYCPPDVAEVAGKVLADSRRGTPEREFALEILRYGISHDDDGSPESLRALKAALEVERDPDMRKKILHALQWNRGQE